MKRLGKFSLALSLLTVACASGPELERYSRREIDRTYTLPKGVANWHIPVVFAHIRDDQSSLTIPPIPVPLLWEVGLAESWSLIWFPLPLGLAHEFYNDGSSRVGATLSTGFSYDSSTGFRLQPSFSLSHRQKLTDAVAWSITPAFTPDFAFQSGQPFRWTLGLSTGPLLQLTETFALEPNVGADWSHGRAPFLTASFGESGLRDETNFSLDFGVRGIWSAGRQWDIRPSYNFSGIGSKNGYRAHLAMVDFVHFW